jgi:ubiquinone biosynthesis protein
VLVSQWLDGTPLGEAPAGALDAAAARLVVFVIGGLRAGLVHADVNPDDVLVLPGGGLGILDFGAVAAVEPARADAGLALVEAFAAGDGERLGAALGTLGLLDPAHGDAALDLAAHVLGELGGALAAELDTAALVAARGRLEERQAELLRLLLAGSLPPQELWPARGVAMAFGTIARVGATGAWRELVLSSLREGWSAAP